MSVLASFPMTAKGSGPESPSEPKSEAAASASTVLMASTCLACESCCASFFVETLVSTAVAPGKSMLPNSLIEWRLIVVWSRLSSTIKET